MSSENILNQWLEEERQVRERLHPVGVIPIAQLAAYTGLEFLEKMLAGELPSTPIANTLDFILIHVELGKVIFQGNPQFHHYNPLGSVHGGWFCTLLDSAVGCAIQTQLPKGKGYTTLEIKVNMMRPLTQELPVIRAEGRTLHVGRQTAVAEGKIIGVDGKVYAHATTTCLIFDI